MGSRRACHPFGVQADLPSIQASIAAHTLGHVCVHLPSLIQTGWSPLCPALQFTVFPPLPASTSSGRSQRQCTSKVPCDSFAMCPPFQHLPACVTMVVAPTARGPTTALGCPLLAPHWSEACVRRPTLVAANRPPYAAARSTPKTRLQNPHAGPAGPKSRSCSHSTREAGRSNQR